MVAERAGGGAVAALGAHVAPVSTVAGTRVELGEVGRRFPGLAEPLRPLMESGKSSVLWREVLERLGG